MKLPMRPGKTQKDHDRKVHGNRFKNREARLQWQKDCSNAGHGRTRSVPIFPLETCNGKKSRSLKG